MAHPLDASAEWGFRLSIGPMTPKVRVEGSTALGFEGQSRPRRGSATEHWWRARGKHKTAQRPALFPTLEGRHCDKDKFVTTLVKAGQLLGVREPPDGSERIPGHSHRVTGAQGLTRLGLEPWAV